MQDGLLIYNTLSGKKEKFEALNPPFVGLYVCGPTVYSEVHIGNIRTFISFDMVYRYLMYLGYQVRYVRNITDVGHLTDDGDEGEDKIEKRARLEKIEPMEIVQKYTNNFHIVTKLFNMLDPSIEPTATGNMLEQMEMVQRIIDNGYGYVVNGSVYFDVEKFSAHYDYGKLSGRKVEELYEQTRSLEGGSEKRFFADFGIWKATKEGTIMKWNSPWGEGVPGWHLECSVMSTKYLGEKFDIHGGGMDLKFPHHECEIAQSIGADGEEPVRYWMHGNMLTVNGTKMSKSLGNSFLPMELIEGSNKVLSKPYHPMVVRFFMMQTHYSSTLDFSDEALLAAEKGYNRMMESLKILNRFDENDFGSEETDKDTQVQLIIDSCKSSMDDDFNTPKTLAALFELSNIVNKVKHENYPLAQKTIGRMKKAFEDYLIEIMGVKPIDENNNDALNGLMDLILDIRKQARESKDWATSDLLRDKLNALNILVKDGKEGANWSFK